MSRPYENLGNYMTLNVFCNKLGRELCKLEETGNKSQDFSQLCSNLKSLLDKYSNWSIMPRYNPFVNKLLNSEEEYKLFESSIKTSDKKSAYKQPKDIADKIVQYINEVENSKEMTNNVKEGIDYLVNFLNILSDSTLFKYTEQKGFNINEEFSVKYNVDKRIFPFARSMQKLLRKE